MDGAAQVGGMSGWIGWAVLGAGVGMLAGVLGRVLLDRLRRGTRIPPPWCELAVGAVWAVVVGGVAAGIVSVAWAPLLAAAGWLGVVAGVVDLRHHRLPDALTLPALPAVLLLAVPLGWGAVGRAAAGAALLAAVHLAVHAVSPTALGLGDVKLAAPVGAVLAAGSWAALAVGCALAALLSGLVGAVVGARELRGRVRSHRREDRAAAVRAELPHGPSMLAAAWLTTFAAAAGGGLSGAVGVVGAG
ncbi:prepilin peptidase [Pseudonocardia xishanensis]|uniref:Prepilin type IV endopeptidase peptidase domain-containing protein n=1 Tax=Pseudonocardia xishanensis TaxID=630995 RepID=A0ABP8S1D4_9PSEU